MIYIGDKTLNRFWNKVWVRGPDDCWEWAGPFDKDGYGRFQENYKQWRAHRLSWTIRNGEIPKGLLICHKCDNPSCVNPNHLFVGTYKNNAQDCSEKNRTHKTNPTRKISNKQVEEIRFKNFLGCTQQRLSVEYGVSQTVIWRIVNYEREYIIR